MSAKRKNDPARELLEAHACDQGTGWNELIRQRALYLIETEGLLDDVQLHAEAGGAHA